MEGKVMPYYWPKPIYHALMLLAGKRKEKNLDEMVLKILKEELRREGILKPPSQCLHEEYAIYRSRKVWMCEECGLEFDSEIEILNAQRRAREEFQKRCKHEWEYEVRPAEDHLLRDEKGRFIGRFKFEEEKVPTVCKKCGLKYSELGL